MELGIAGKKVLVTGASRGIGRAIAVAYAQEQCVVTAVARNEDRLKSLVEAMRSFGAGHRYYAADLMVDSVPRDLARRLIDENRVYDIVVHCVGGSLGVDDPLAPMTGWRYMWQFNAGIAIEMNELLIPPMMHQGWGRVIHISSASAESLRGRPPYASAKAYLNAYAKTLGRAIAKSGVVVSSIMPGPVAYENSYWDEQSRTQPQRVEDFLRHHQAVGRMGTPEEIAHFAVFLGSELATFAHAAVIPVDGGNM